MSGRTVLYVEDKELNRKIVRGLLRATKYTLIEANDGEAGVAKALTAAKSEPLQMLSTTVVKAAMVR